MKTLSSPDLFSLPVYTQSNDELGHIIAFELDPLQHSVQYYYVKKSTLVPTFLQSHKIESSDHKIHKSQVISLTSERMVVEDLNIKDELLMPKKATPLLEEDAS